jgi:hypothetical protein
MTKRTVGSRLLEGYSKVPAGVRKYTDRAIKGGAAVTRKLHGDGAKRKGEQWAKAQRSKIGKKLGKYRI